MEVKSKAEAIKLLDEAIVLADELIDIVSGFEPFMKDILCCNTHQYREPRKLP